MKWLPLLPASSGRKAAMDGKTWKEWTRLNDVGFWREDELKWISENLSDLLDERLRAERYRKALEVIADCQIIPGCIDCRQVARDAMKEGGE